VDFHYCIFVLSIIDKTVVVELKQACGEDKKWRWKGEKDAKEFF
jgi:hypothetical protein